jgi:hypothetical protein
MREPEQRKKDAQEFVGQFNIMNYRQRCGKKASPGKSVYASRISTISPPQKGIDKRAEISVNSRKSSIG